jgi:hemerythrin
MIWKEKYRIGVEQIDRQHEELFRRVTDFVETLRSADSWAQKEAGVNETLAFMRDYVVTHFGDEERLQARIGYPGFEKHRAIHNDFVRYVGDISRQYEEMGYNEQIMQQFAGRLLAWLINHVVAEDQKIAAYLGQKEESRDER